MKRIAALFVCCLLAGGAFYLLVLEPDDRSRLRTWLLVWKRT